MSNEVSTANAEAAKSSVEKSITVDEFINRRIGGKDLKAETPKDNATGESKASAPADAPKADDKKESVAKVAAEVAKDVHSKEVDLETMSESELSELAQKLGSRAVARFGELTAKRKQAEERAAALQAELARREQAIPPPPPPMENNPYANINTLPELQAKAKELGEVVEWAEEVLWQNETASPSDVVTNVNGTELTKAQVRKALKDAQKASKEYIPAQAAEINATVQRFAIRNQLEANARKELDWLKDDNETRRQFETLRQSPVVQKAMAKVPELAPYMEYMVAHAANSIYGRKSIGIETKPTAAVSKAIEPPDSPSTAAATSERSDSKDAKASNDKYKRFSQTGNPRDFVAFRTSQITKRKSL